jgi:uncharacterized protein
MKMTIYKDKSHEWRWRLRTANGKTIADSGESYKTKRGAINAVHRLWAAYDGTAMREAIKAALESFAGAKP